MQDGVTLFNKKRLQWVLWLGLPILLAFAGWMSRPFAKNVTSITLSTRTLSPPQIANIRAAAQRVDSVILRPQESFSFNRTVGPRTETRGYRIAPSYLEGDTPATMGGGICLLSSGLYQLALHSGLDILERVPHLRTIHSVPPGLDATVWYGKADLQFKNTLPTPVRIRTALTPQALTLRLEASQDTPKPSIARLINRQGPASLQVVLLRDGQAVSRDLYRISP